VERGACPPGMGWTVPVHFPSGGLARGSAEACSELPESMTPLQCGLASELTRWPVKSSFDGAATRSAILLSCM
jgi:hypothetical protein